MIILRLCWYNVHLSDERHWFPTTIIFHLLPSFLNSDTIKYMRKYNKIRPLIEQPDDPTIRYIPLTRSKYAIVNASDYEWLMQWNWFAIAFVKLRFTTRCQDGRKKIDLHAPTIFGRRLSRNRS